MRPIELRLSGLHSYREAQVIDFEAAIGRGLFGIFGPTGSGKSSILDAVTLALYGEVKRAPRGTQGIVNLAEGAAEVAFTFELREGGRALRYRAERRYVRGKDGSGVRAATCRLVDLSAGEPVVVADKADDMTRRVEGILGLEADDFTRAVVLPQGRFAEFLHLRGGPRREMLQRLFDLERYGVRLNERLKVHLEVLASRRTGLEAEMAGIGDASPQTVRAAQEAALAAGREVAAARATRGAAQATVAETRAVRALEDRLRAARADLDAVEARQGEVAALSARLEAARKADALRDLLSAAASARASAQAATERRIGADAARERDAMAVEAASKRLAAWQEAVLGERPELEARRRELVEAEALERELGDGAGALEAARQAASYAEAERTATEGRLGVARAHLRELEQEQGAREAEAAALRVPAELRGRVGAAMAALRRAGDAKARLQAAEEALQSAAGERARAEEGAATAADAAAAAEAARAAAADRLESVRGQRHPDEQALGQEVRALETVRATWAECARLAGAVRDALARSREAGDALARAKATTQATSARVAEAAAAEAAAERSLAVAREELERARREDMAGHLARALAQGAPCPVCGSLEHPAPAATATEDGAAVAGPEAAAQAAEAALAEARAAATAATAARAAAASAVSSEEQRRAEAERFLAGARDELAARAALLPEDLRCLVGDVTLGTVDAPAGDAFFVRRETALHAAEAEVRAWRAGLEEAREAVDAAAAELLEARQRQGAMQASLAAKRASEAAAEGQRRLAVRDLDKAQSAFAAASEGASAEDIEVGDARIAACDASLERLELDIAAAASAITRARDDAQAAESGLAGAGTVAAARSRELERLEAAAQTLAVRLAHLLREDQGPASAALSRVQARLEELETEGGRLTGEAARASDTARKSELEASQARALEAAALEAAVTAEARLERRVARAGFADAAAAQSALVPPEEMAAAEASLRREREACAAAQTEVDRLGRELSGRATTDEALAAAEVANAEADAAEAAARERAGAANHALEELERRGLRWQAASEELTQVRADVVTARDLQGVLYGGQFIDFMAEEHLRQIAADGSARLGGLTRYRYALELDSEGSFQVRDDHNGGQHRPATSLSGGETFLASLALALALSAQVQLRGRYPLEFFFLDEGFGSLDPDLLETVVTALERLQLAHVHIGLITHVLDLRSRVPTRLIVEPAIAGEHGSRIRFEAG